MKRAILKGIAYGLLFFIWEGLVADVTIQLRPDLGAEPGVIQLTDYAKSILEVNTK